MNFKSEKNIEGRKRIDCETWNRIQQSLQDDPGESKEDHDPRPLYQRLMERKQKEEINIKEANKASIDQEIAADAEYINEVNKIKFMHAIHLIENDKKAIEEFKLEALKCREDDYKILKNGKSIKPMKLRNMNSINKQKELISKAIKKGPPSALKTIAVLPGIGNYELSDTSSSSTSSDSDRDELDDIKLTRSAKTQKVEAED